jgi:2-oxoglutarate ferredoxin oxidoreductase subunit delta
MDSPEASVDKEADQGSPKKGHSVETSEKKTSKQFEIDIFEAWCKACGICAAFCPKKCFALDEDGAPVVSHPEQCNGCGWCEIHCPDFAISVSEKKPRKHEEINEEDDGV